MSIKRNKIQIGLKKIIYDYYDIVHMLWYDEHKSILNVKIFHEENLTYKPDDESSNLNLSRLSPPPSLPRYTIVFVQILQVIVMI